MNRKDFDKMPVEKFDQVMAKSSEIGQLSFRLEKLMDWREWMKKIPYIDFGDDLEVSVIPPFAGAMTRFLVRLKGKESRISVYLDCHDILGYMEEPYWEAYAIKGDTARFLLNETKELVEAIRNELNEREIKSPPLGE